MSNAIKEFTRANYRTLMDEIEAALKPIAEKHGLALDRKSRSFYADRLPVKFDLLVTTKDKDGNTVDPKAAIFASAARLFGLKPDDFGKEFTSRGETFRITGLNLRRRKYPVSAERVRDGKGFKFPAEDVRLFLERAT